MNLKSDPDLIYSDDPMFRSAMFWQQRRMEEFNEAIGQTIDHLQESFGLMKAMGELNQKLMIDLQKLSQLFSSLNTKEKLHNELISPDNSEILPSQKIPRESIGLFFADNEQSNERQEMTRTSVLCALKWLTDWNESRRNMMNELQTAMIDPLVDFHNKIEHVSKTYRKNLDKAQEEYETSVSRFVSKRQKKLDAAQQLYNAKKNTCYAFKSFVDYVNTWNSAKDFFTVNKMIHLSKIFQTYRVIPAGGDSALAEHVKYLRLSSALTEASHIFDVNQLHVALPNNLFEEQLYELRIALELQARPSNLLSPSPPAEKRGYLWKKSKSPIKPWSRRYFWIEKNRLMSYNKSMSGSVLILPLSRCMVNANNAEERPFVFEITLDEGVYSFQAENESDKLEWLRIIEAASNSVEPSLPHIERSNSIMDLFNPRREDSVQADLVSAGLGNSSKPAKSSVPFNPASLSENLIQKLASTSNLDDSVVHSGLLSLKEIRPRRPSLDGKDYINVIWRSGRFILQKDGKLFQMNETTNSPKDRIEIIDFKKFPTLTRYHVNVVDESLFQRKNVFVIRLVEAGRNLFFASNSGIERNQWVFALKQIAGGALHGADYLPYRIVRSLSIRVIEGRSFNTNTDPYCEIYFGRDRMARTNSKGRGQSEPFWREDFLFEDFPALKHGITIYIMTQNKISKDNELGRVILPANQLKTGDVEAWYPVMSVQDSGFIANMTGGSANSGPAEHYGDLKLKIKYEEDIVLSKTEYSELAIVFTNVDQPLVYDMAVMASDLESAACLLLNIYDAQGLAIPWLCYLIEEEIEKTESIHVLFRGNSILTKALDAYMKICGMDYLESTLGEILTEICETKLNCEVDPTRLEKNDDLKMNWRKFYSTCEHIWTLIEKSRPNIPREMRLVFHHIQKTVMQRFQQDTDKYNSVRYTSISGFLFLRFFCPAILNPKLFGLYKNFPDPKTSRSLTLIAKTLQCLANLANFGVKEPYMVDMNGFIMEHSNHLMEFIDNVSTVPSNTTPLSDHCVDLDRQFCYVHRFVRENYKKFKSLRTLYQNRVMDLSKNNPKISSRFSDFDKPLPASISHKPLPSKNSADNLRPSEEPNTIESTLTQNTDEDASEMSSCSPPRKSHLGWEKKGINTSMPNLSAVDKPSSPVLSAGVAKLKLGTVVIASSNSSLHNQSNPIGGGQSPGLSSSQSFQAAFSSNPANFSSSSTASAPSAANTAPYQSPFNARMMHDAQRVASLYQSVTQLLRASDVVHQRLLSKFPQK